MREGAEWESGDHLMRCTGVVYTIHSDDAEGRGWVEVWERGAPVRLALEASWPALSAYWNRLRRGGACFAPSASQLAGAGFPAGMA